MFEIATAEVLWYVDYALGEMTRILSEMGDELANERPAIPGANSPFAIVTHCLGVMEFWGGDKIAGRHVVRDRPAEFTALGRVADLVERIRVQSATFADDLRDMQPSAPPRSTANPKDSGLPLARSQAGVVFHVIEELYQHLGHLELTRDIIVQVAGQSG